MQALNIYSLAVHMAQHGRAVQSVPGVGRSLENVFDRVVHFINPDPQFDAAKPN
jgi:hypothetical protein